jgi:hypothetical protein
VYFATSVPAAERRRAGEALVIAGTAIASPQKEQDISRR